MLFYFSRDPKNVLKLLIHPDYIKNMAHFTLQGHPDYKKILYILHSGIARFADIPQI